MAGNYFGYAAASGGPYGAHSGYAAGQTAFVSAEHAFAAAANARSTFQTYEAGPPGPAYAYPPRPTMVTVAVGPQYQANTGYDAALYSAATTYYRQQQGPRKSGGVSQWLGSKKESTAKMPRAASGSALKSKAPAKTPQLHYCDICKISCAGPQTYREHLEGQKHKKKEAAASASALTSGVKSCPSQFYCELCTVTCTGTDAYAAHVRGAKHQKVLNLYAKLGKPLPPNSAKHDEKALPTGSGDGVKTPSSVPAAVKATITKSGDSNIKLSAVAIPKTAVTVVAKTVADTTNISEVVADGQNREGSDPCDGSLPREKSIVAIGQEYVEELRDEAGKVVSFNCKLCQCKFNDPCAKDTHTKGRRHRLQYKKKVDPSICVDVKANGSKRKLEEMRQRRQDLAPSRWKEVDISFPAEIIDMDQDHYGCSTGQYSDTYYAVPHILQQPAESAADHHVRAKHADIYPTDEELFAVQSIVDACEKGLKLVSDQLAAASALGGNRNSSSSSDGVLKDDGRSLSESAIKESRLLKGVMRVGALAKGLVLTGDLNVELVLVCAVKPSMTLLDQVAELLPGALRDMAAEEYQVTKLAEDAALLVSGASVPSATCTVTMTSPLMREGSCEEQSIMEPTDVLDRRKCLDALAALRRAKWFQAKASPIPACVMLVRILKDMRKNVAVLSAVSEWALELLVEHCLTSATSPMGLGDSLRRVLECIAGGLFLPGGPGLLDPCEKEPIDAIGPLSLQQRDDLTAFAQKSLRMIAFKQLPQLLNASCLPASDLNSSKAQKRRASDAQDEASDHGGEIKKKKVVEYSNK